jgi:ABC-type nitrate/sulfonate/bicarbonate transport system substrate-binding protein
MRNSRMRVRLATGAIAGAAAASLVAGCASSGTSGASGQTAGITDVSIATPANSAASAFLYVAQDAGFFKQNGLKVSLDTSIAPASTPSALVKGSVQATALTGTASTAHQAGLPLVNIVETATHAPFVILAAPGITSTQQLAGKTLVTSPPFGSLGAASNDVLTRAGIKGKVKLVALDAVPAKSALFVAGKGNAIFEALNNAMDDQVKRPGSTIITGPNSSSIVPANGLAVTESFFKSKPQIVKELVKSSLQAANLMKNDPTKAAAIMKQAFHLSPANAKAFVKFQAPSMDLTGVPSTAAYQNQAAQFNSAEAPGTQKVNWTSSLVAASWNTSVAKQVSAQLGYSK